MQALWNAKFGGEALLYGEEPNHFIKEHLELLLPCERIMCLGEGEGRNAIFLADKGLEVEAHDASDVALLKLRKRAKAHYVQVKVRHTLLEHCPYLHVPKKEQPLLFSKALEALKVGGIFIAELFSESQKSFHSGGPKEPDLLYNLNDISDTLKFLPCTILKLAQEIVILHEGEKHVGRASVIRVICKKLPI